MAWLPWVPTEREREFLLSLLIRTWFILIKATPLWPYVILITSLETPSLNIATLEVKALMSGFWEDTTQSLTKPKDVGTGQQAWERPSCYLVGSSPCRFGFIVSGGGGGGSGAGNASLTHTLNKHSQWASSSSSSWVASFTWLLSLGAEWTGKTRLISVKIFLSQTKSGAKILTLWTTWDSFPPSQVGLESTRPNGIYLGSHLKEKIHQEQRMVGTSRTWGSSDVLLRVMRAGPWLQPRTSRTSSLRAAVLPSIHPWPLSLPRAGIALHSFWALTDICGMNEFIVL